MQLDFLPLPRRENNSRPDRAEQDAMNIPAQLRYTKEHEWIDVDNNIAIVGITDWAQSELGDVVFVELPNVGDSVILGEPFGTIEAVKAVSELFAPVTGKVVGINPEIESDPTVVNRSAFDQAWLIKIEIANAEELNGLLSAEQYAKLID